MTLYVAKKRHGIPCTAEKLSASETIALFQGDTIQTGRLRLGYLPQFLNTKVSI